jgi:glycine cleavage system transcriptional repressor
MKKNLIISLIGHDRVGLVKSLTKLIVEANGNIEASRMAHLGGEFAILMFVSLDTAHLKGLEQKTQELLKEGFKVIITETKQSDPSQYKGWLPYRIEVNGADHEGIIHAIAERIAALGINIESMDTNTIKAPITGTPLFIMTAVVFAPPDRNHHDLYDQLKPAGDELNVDIDVLPYKG